MLCISYTYCYRPLYSDSGFMGVTGFMTLTKIMTGLPHVPAEVLVAPFREVTTKPVGHSSDGQSVRGGRS